MNSSPFFRAAIIALTLLVLAVLGIFTNAVHAADLARAPVVQPVKDSNVMKQIGWFTYEKKPGIVVLYCVPEGSTSLTCVIYAVTEKESGVVLIDGIPATELRT